MMQMDARQIVERACARYGESAVEKLRRDGDEAVERDSYYAAAIDYLAASNLSCYINREEIRSQFAQALDDYYKESGCSLESLEPQIMSSIMGAAVDHAYDDISAHGDTFDAAALQAFRGHIPYFDESNPFDEVIPDSMLFEAR